MAETMTHEFERNGLQAVLEIIGREGVQFQKVGGYAAVCVRVVASQRPLKRSARSSAISRAPRSVRCIPWPRRFRVGHRL